jgi:hypothetical protein
VHEGWIREGLDDVVARGRDGRRSRGGSLLSRLRSRREPSAGQRELSPDELPYARSGGRVERLEPDDALADEDVLAPEPEEYDAPASAPPQRYESAPEPIAVAEPLDHTLYESRSVHGVPTNAELKVARAMELFNQSPQIRTVAGVARSLGAPIVSARPSRTEGSVVTIVVAWELSWYRYRIDLGDERDPVSVLGKGQEIEELDESQREWNAFANEDGHLGAGVVSGER